jgi:transposase
MTQFSTDIPTRTIGIDLGDRDSVYCILNAAGKVIEEDSVINDQVALEERFGSQSPARIVIEASCQSQWICRCLEGQGHEVIVANPRQVQLISKSTRKNDRNDALLLARLGRMDPELLRPVTTRSERSAAVKAILRARSQLVATRTKLVNLVRSECKVTGSRIPTCSAESFHRQARPYLPATLRTALEPVLDVLAELQLRVRAYDKEIIKLSDDEYPETQTLKQITGVGPLVALTYVVTVDDPRRFPRSRTLGCFFGLVPRSFQSGDRDPQLRISKAGDSTMRKLLVGAATYILRKSSPACDLKRYGMRIARGGSKRDRARARVAVARKLAVLLHRLWLTGEVYDPNYAAT